MITHNQSDTVESGGFVVEMEHSFKGNFLPPAILNAYPPEIITAITVMAQSDQTHDQAKELQAANHSHELNKADKRLEFWGLFVGGAVILTCLILGAILVLHGSAAVGCGLIAVGFLAGVSKLIFSYARPEKSEPAKLNADEFSVPETTTTGTAQNALPAPGSRE